VSTQYYTADFLYSENQRWPKHYLKVEDGVIAEVGACHNLSDTELQQVQCFPNAAIIPGFVNTHNHSFQSLLKGFCDDADFFTWRDQALYKYSKIMSSEDIYNGALFAFGEMLKNGITTVCDFFYINDQANDNAKLIIKAAQDLGIRFVMARTMYDWDGAPSRYRETVSQAVANTETLIQEYLNDPMVSVLPAPHSLHGASVEMIEAGAALAQQYQTLFHMHVAEGQYEREMMEKEHGMSPIRFLNHLGVLNERMVGIHCVWLDDEEIQMMADRQAKVSYNPSSNMFLGDGITRIKELLDVGVCISLGTDGGCSNNRASIIEEMRMTNLLQKVRFCDATQSNAEDAFLMGTSNGGITLGQKLGKLAPGYAADFVVVDLNDLSMQPREFFGKNIVYSAMPSALKASYVAGKAVMKNGILINMAESEIVSRVQQTLQTWQQVTSQ
jgi:5-methylthioadenosine/S-adenosylhomocysteine deaminase